MNKQFVLVFTCSSIALASCGQDAQKKDSPLDLRTSERRDLGQNTPLDQGTNEADQATLQVVDMLMDQQAPTCVDGVQNGKETGVDCGGLCDKLCPPCKPDSKRMFVSKLRTQGKILQEMNPNGELEEADALCTKYAQDAGLGGRWRAWLSSPQQSAKSRVQDAGPWYLVDQCTLVAESLEELLSSGPRVVVDRDEEGNFLLQPSYWTGTKTNGSSTLFMCFKWRSIATLRQGTIGEPREMPLEKSWTESKEALCTVSYALLCMEQ